MAYIIGSEVTRCASNRGIDFLEEVSYLPAKILEKWLTVQGAVLLYVITSLGN